MDENVQLKNQTPQADAMGPQGIGGWLGFFVFSCAMSILKLLADTLRYIPDIERYVSLGVLWAVIVDFIYYAVALGLLIAILVNIFKRNIRFRLLFTIMVCFQFLYFFYALMIALIMRAPIAQVFQPLLVAVFIKDILWIVYLYNSKRVRNTFILKVAEAHQT